jgi:hypothetical protein
MPTHRLVAPRQLGPPNGNPAHDGTIITTRQDETWGTDATRFYTEADGWCWFFGAIDHHLDELVGWHVAKLGDRWAALEPLRQGVRHAFGAFGKDVARSLAVRCDWSPQYIADAWINEVKWLGITISPSCGTGSRVWRRRSGSSASSSRGIPCGPRLSARRSATGLMPPSGAQRPAPARGSDTRGAR